KAIGKPDAGKPHVRFDEGEQVSTVAGLLSTLLAPLCRTLLVRHHCSFVHLTNHDSAGLRMQACLLTAVIIICYFVVLSCKQFCYNTTYGNDNFLHHYWYSGF
ncbi:MAG: hypothetical protein J7K75_02940, partial [Desulfuromonas sp.]|nr:hypothetical protein [Desulfuromonas sp.]